MDSPPSDPVFSVRRAAGATWVDLGARPAWGYAGPLLFFVLFGVLAFPLASAGIVALTWTDFGALRWLMGLGGALGLVLLVLPFGHIAAQTLVRRERVTLDPSGATVEVTLPWAVRRVRLSRPIQVADGTWVDHWGLLPYTKAATRIVGADGAAWVGAGLSATERASLQAALVEPVAAGNSPSPPPHAYSVRERLRRARLRPTPYTALDLGSLAAVAVTAAAGGEEGLAVSAEIYLVCVLVALGGLALRRWDPAYLAGLREWRTHLWFDLVYVAAAFPVAIGAAFAAAWAMPGESAWLGLGSGAVLGIALVGLHVVLLRSSREEGPVSEWASRLATLSLIPLAWAHEKLAFLALEGASRGLGVIALPIVFTVVWLVYGPVRLHGFVAAPRDRGNLRSCLLTIAALTAWGIFGVTW